MNELHYVDCGLDHVYLLNGCAIHNHPQEAIRLIEREIGRESCPAMVTLASLPAIREPSRALVRHALQDRALNRVPVRLSQ